mgnify:CR=1 FL=1
MFIVDGAETMRPDAANAFLKVLEEPPESAAFLEIDERRGDSTEMLAALFDQGSRFMAEAPDATLDALIDFFKG